MRVFSLSKETFSQAARFIFSGILTTLIHFLILHGLFIRLGCSVLFANSVAFFLAASFSYCANYWFTFKSNKSHKQSAPRFVITVSVGYLLNASLIHILVQIQEYDYRLAFLFITCIVMISNFFINKFPPLRFVLFLRYK